MVLPGTMFEPRTAVLTPGDMVDVNRLADNLLANPNERVVVKGYADNIGSPITEQQLSEERANAVRDTLIARGVNPDRVAARGFGGQFPIASNRTEAGREQNRRVEIVVTG